MFAKAQLKRFNDDVKSTPAPTDYNPQEPKKKGTNAPVTKSERFAEPKQVTPGPGQYNVKSSSINELKRRPSLRRSRTGGGLLTAASKNSSRASSANSLVFTDVDEDVCFKTPVKAPPSAKGDLQRAKEQLERRVTELNDELEEAKCAVEAKEAELAARTEEKAALEAANESLNAELAECRLRESLLKEEVDLLNQDNKSLEEKLGDAKSSLEAERRALDEKSTFLHFTQEQLNSEVETLRSRVDKLEAEKASLSGKLAEVTEVYVAENSETETEFHRLEAAKKQLADDIEALKESNEAIRTEAGEHKAKYEESIALLEEAESAKAQLEAKVVEMATDVEVHVNDKSVLHSEMARLDREKNEMALDLAAVNRAKVEVDLQLEVVGKEKEFLLGQVGELLDEKAEVERRLASGEKAVNDLQGEVEELEMKNSSLDGALSSSQNEVANLASENASLYNSFESLEESLRSYIRRNGELDDAINELEEVRDDLNRTCVILEARMLAAEKIVNENRDKMDELFIEITNKDGELKNHRTTIEELESKILDLQACLDLWEERHLTMEERQEENEARTKAAEDGKKALEDEVAGLRANMEEAMSERGQLFTMNQGLSSQSAEQLASIKRLQDSERDLSSRLEKAKRDLELAHNGMTAELHSHWEAEDEVLRMQSELDETEAMLTDAKAQLAEGQKARAAGDVANAELASALAAAESELADAKNGLTAAQAEAACLRKDLAAEREKTARLDEQAAVRSERVSVLERALESANDEASSLALSLNARKCAEADLEAVRKLLDAKEDQLAEGTRRVLALERNLADKNSLLEKLRLESAANNYKEKYEALSAMVEPFKDQLESFEMERNSLLARNEEAQGQVSRLADQYAQLLGHQNHKQKIHHLVRIKQENLDMRQELAKLRLDLSKQTRLVAKLKEGHNKENSSTSNLVLSAANTPHNKMIRRQTIASPLSNRNGQRH